MLTVDQICEFLETLAPPDLAEDWDNVGLLVGDRAAEITHIMCCLTITPDTIEEAIEEGAQMVIAHHPLPFRSLKRLTSDTTVGRQLLHLIAARIAVYSPHTSFDSAKHGVNQRLAEGLELVNIQPLVPSEHGLGAGRWGRLPVPLSMDQLIAKLKTFLSVPRMKVVDSPARFIRNVGVGCGSAGEFLDPAGRNGCDCLVTGETSFHTCLEAEASGIGMVLAGHFASERFAVEFLADVIGSEFPACKVWASRRERDPIRWV